MRALLALLLLPATLRAAEPAERLLEAFGASGFEQLRKDGLIVVHGKPGAWRLQAVDWKTLGELSKRAKAAVALSEARKALAAGEPVTGGFASLGELPARSPMTPALHAAVVALSGYIAEAAALPEGAPQGPHLFETRWGKRFAARTGADHLEDPAPLAKAFYDQTLAALEPDPGAREHFASWVSARHNVEVDPILDRDLASGLASDELKNWIKKYLIEQRRLLQLARVRAAVKSLGRTLDADLAALLAVTTPLVNQRLLAEMETWARPAYDGAAKLKSVGLHVPQPTRLGQHELGDAVTLTGGYWVDGLPEGASITVEETTFVETEEGFGRIETKQARRGNGGPYPLSRRLTLWSSKPFTFRAAVSAEGSEPLSDTVQVPVGKDYELALKKFAVAEQRSALCDFKASEASFSELEQSLEDAAKEKPQYRALRDAAKLRRGQDKRRGDELAKVEELIASSRADASPDKCDYDETATVGAIRRVRGLPAGCDKLLPDLERQLATIRRRAADQKLFAKLIEQARGRWKDCSFIAAAQTYASALAVLDADPAARCGKTAELAEAAERDLPAARADLLWRDEYTRQLNSAESEVSPEKRLELLRPILARIDGGNAPGCFSAQRKRADTLLKKAAAALVSPEPSEIERLLPRDAGLAQTVSEVSGNRRALVADIERLEEARAEEQGPPVEEPADEASERRREPARRNEEAGAGGEAPKPAVKPKAAPAPKKRYSPRKRS